jgi:hypothetical protein
LDKMEDTLKEIDRSLIEVKVEEDD